MYKPITNEKEDLRVKIQDTLKRVFNYTDDNNPFGDPNLSKPFIWYKKNDFLEKKRMNTKLNVTEILNRIEQAKPEIEKNRIRKIQRDEMRLKARQLELLKNTEKISQEEMKEKPIKNG